MDLGLDKELNIQKQMENLQQIISQQQRTSGSLSKKDEPVGMVDCEICKGLGFILKQDDGITTSKYCNCVRKKIIKKDLKKRRLQTKKGIPLKIMKQQKIGN